MKPAKDMTDGELRKAVAELRGWKVEKTPFGDERFMFWLVAPNGAWDGAAYESPEKCWEMGVHPKYEEDLNAMHEAEEILTDVLRLPYRLRLDVITAPDGDGAFASARQRAEAFVETMRKAKE